MALLSIRESDHGLELGYRSQTVDKNIAKLCSIVIRR